MKTALEKPALISRKLTHRFGDKVALNSLDLSISSSGVTALLGANGAGKTTLINCALGLCKPSSGSITVFGRTPLGHHLTRLATENGRYLFWPKRLKNSAQIIESKPRKSHAIMVGSNITCLHFFTRC